MPIKHTTYFVNWNLILIDWLKNAFKTKQIILVIQLFSMAEPLFHHLHIIHAQLNYTYMARGYDNA